VPGYLGFAIGRSIFSDPLKGWLRGLLGRDEAVRAIARSYRRFVDVYAAAAAAPAAA
jgi:5-dehydro-2-deoxygluconokinase